MTTRQRATAVRFGCLFGFLVLWELGVRVEMLDPRFVSSPVRIATTLPGMLTDSAFLEALVGTGSQVAIAFVVGAAAGIFVGTLLGTSKALYDAYFGILLFVLATPKTVFLPLFILFFGFGDTPATAFGAFTAFFYVAVNVVSGMEMVEDRHRRVATAFRASRWQAFVHLLLPVSLPGIVTGLWHGARHAIGGVLIAQLFIGHTGIGGLLKTYADSLNTDRMMTLVLIVSIIAILFGSFWTHVEARVSQWRVAGASATGPAIRLST